MTQGREDRPVTEQADGIIRIMPDVLANKIAAGEVVGRPASVVKELIENSLDAGATSIDVVLTDNGRTLIQIVDNGSGMSPADAERSFQRHATSKLREFSDLERIHTLGFRGEALASIGSVARVEMKTRRVEDESGTRVLIEGGDLSLREPCAMPTGTSVAVRQLFYNVPARRAFLKSDATELGRMIQTVQNLAVSHPTVGFSATHDGNNLLRLEAMTGSRDEAARARICDLFGHDEASLLLVAEQTSYLAVRGWIGQPEVRRKARGEQFLFVNGRAVRSRYLEHAVYGSYRGLIPEGTFPFFVLYLDVDTRHVDVNVHPAKEQVKFDDERGIYSMLRAVIGRGLSEGAGVLRFEDGAVNLIGGTPEGGDSGGNGWEGAPLAALNGARGDLGQLSHDLYGSGVASRIASKSTDGAGGGVAEREKLVWQVLGSYIVAPLRTGVLIVDQHAAHERVIFERSLKALQDGFGLSQQLLFPTVTELQPAEFALLEGLLPDLRAIGFDLAPMSGRSVMIRGLPADIRAGDERTILTELLDQYRVFVQRMKLSSRELLARALARRSSIPREAVMNPIEMRALIDQLFQCTEPYTSPGGQPTLIRITGDELARRFGASR